MHETIVEGAEVSVELSRVLYSCCGGGWHQRLNADRYQGKVTMVNPKCFMLVYGAEFGRLISVIAEWEHVLSVDAVPAMA